MWLDSKQSRKWNPAALESRIFAIAEAEAIANGLPDAEAAGAAMEAVYQVMRWLQAARSYKDVAEMVKETYGVETSPAALHGFWGRFASPYLSETQRRHAQLATELANTTTPEQEAEVERQLWKQIREAAFEAMHSPGGNEAAVVKLGKLLVSKQKNDVDARKVALLEEKAKKLDEAQSVMGSALSQQEKDRRIREILK